MIPFRFFVTSTGTNAGKTWVTRALCRALTIRNHSVFALKPIETGCVPDARDAFALARACRNPSLADTPGLYRAPLPLSPYAVSLMTGAPPPDISRLADRVKTLANDCDFMLVESAGGLLVPTSRVQTTADLALAIGFPLVVVVPDALGVLSHSLTLCECATSRGLDIRAFVLVRQQPGPQEIGPGSNCQILSERFSFPVVAFPYCSDNDDTLASAAASSGLLTALHLDSL
jgi:dethiobiotin synthetase